MPPAFYVPATPQLGFGYPSREAKTGTTSTAGTSIIPHELRHVFGEKKVSGEAGG